MPTGQPGPPCDCGECKLCRSRAAQRRYRQAHPERAAEATRRYMRRAYAENPDKYRQATRRWYQENIERAREYGRARGFRPPPEDAAKAYNAVNVAVRTGRLVKQPCEVCGSRRVQAHHDDYAKPLDVRWLCQEHHAAIHRRYP